MERKKLVWGICFFNFELGNTVLKDQETKSSNYSPLAAMTMFPSHVRICLNLKVKTNININLSVCHSSKST